MELLLQRCPSIQGTTLGALSVDGALECVTLEDEVRDLKEDGSGKVQDETAIDAGRYRVTIDFSQRFQKLMLHVLDVKWFTGIRIHSGNTEHDTRGCILVGTHVDSPTRISGGTFALPRLFGKIEKAINAGEEVWITIKNGGV